MDLVKFFAHVPDPRRAEGLRVPLPAFLWMTFLAVASGHCGYRAMGKFARSNAAFFTQYFGLRHAVPSHVSFRSLLQTLDKAHLYQQFNQSFAPHLLAGDWVAGDGQSLRSTVTDAHGAGQQFVSLVGLYCQRTGLTAAVQDYTDKKNGELVVLRQLLPLLQDRGVVLTLDALHGQKKRLPPSSPRATTTCCKSRATNPRSWPVCRPATRPTPNQPGPAIGSSSGAAAGLTRGKPASTPAPTRTCAPPGPGWPGVWSWSKP